MMIQYSQGKQIKEDLISLGHSMREGAQLYLPYCRLPCYKPNSVPTSFSDDIYRYPGRDLDRDLSANRSLSTKPAKFEEATGSISKIRLVPLYFLVRFGRAPPAFLRHRRLLPDPPPGSHDYFRRKCHLPTAFAIRSRFWP